MTAQAHIQPTTSTLLRRVLIADALYEGALGALCLLGAAPVAAFMGLESIWMIDVGLAALAAALLVAGITAVNGWTRGRLMLVIDLNLIGAVLLAVLAFVLPLTAGGKLATLFVAGDFGILAALEYYALRRG